ARIFPGAAPPCLQPPRGAATFQTWDFATPLAHGAVLHTIRHSGARVAASLANAWMHAMSKATAILGSALFFVIAPLLLGGFVPWWITQWAFRPAFFGVELTRVIGGLLIIAGTPAIVNSFARFALEGLGTPAPIAPPQKLVVTGLYRYVRNPIYIA